MSKHNSSQGHSRQSKVNASCTRQSVQGSFAATSLSRMAMCAALIVLCASTASATTTILLSENFSRGATSLNGLAPSGGGGIYNNAGGTWISSTSGDQVRANGQAISDGAANGSAILNLSNFGISITGGNIYHLKATATTGFSGFVTGFSNGSLTTNGYLGQNAGDSGNLWLHSGNDFLGFDGQWAGGTFIPFSGGYPAQMETVLDTTSSNWTIGYSVNGTQYNTPHTFAGGNPTITQIALTSWSNTSGSVSSFSFEVESVPEPSRTLLMGAGLTGLLLRRRRTRTA